MTNSVPSTVIYQRLWPGFLFGAGTQALDLQFAPREARKILNELRVLAVFFDEIFVPVAHLVTHPLTVHRQIIYKVCSSADWLWARDKEIICLSGRSGLSPIDTVELYKERVQICGYWQEVPNGGIVSELIKHPFKTIETPKQSLDVRTTLLHQIDFIRDQIGNRIHSELRQCIECAEIPNENIPFYHEAFLELLKISDVPEHLREFIWKGSNSLYINVGSYNLSNSIGIPEPQFELYRARRAIDSGVDFRFAAPETLMIHLQKWLGREYYLRFFEANVSVALSFRQNPQSEAYMKWRKFVRWYFEQALDISKELRRLEHVGQAERETAGLISDRIGAVPGMLGDVVDGSTLAIGGAAAIADPTAGLATRSGVKASNSAILKSADVVYKNIFHREAVAFFAQLKRTLRAGIVV